MKEAAGADGGERAASESSLRVRYRETDAMGIAHHSEHLAWFEVGRTDWIRQVGGRDAHGEKAYRRLEAAGFLLPVIAVSVRYLAPARYDDELIVVTRLVQSSRARLAFEYELLLGTDRSVLARGRTDHAVTDRSGRPIRMPAGVLAWLLGDEGGVSPEDVP